MLSEYPCPKLKYLENMCKMMMVDPIVEMNVNAASVVSGIISIICATFVSIVVLCKTYDNRIDIQGAYHTQAERKKLLHLNKLRFIELAVGVVVGIFGFVFSILMATSDETKSGIKLIGQAIISAVCTLVTILALSIQPK